jgi:hypothetical protein
MITDLNIYHMNSVSIHTVSSREYKGQYIPNKLTSKKKKLLIMHPTKTTTKKTTVGMHTAMVRIIS